MHPEIENLINMALADDEVTEKERAIILRKAESLGLDKDEVEMILDGRITLMMKEKNASQNQSKPKSNKEGDLKKCPSCGAPVKSFATVCSDCGHEFRNIEASNSVKDFFRMLNDFESNTEEDTDNPLKAITGTMAKIYSDGGVFGGGKAGRQQRELIKNFPIPNTKEDILDFLTLGVPRAKKIGNFFSSNFSDGAWEMKKHNLLRPVWKSKCAQIILKARILFRNDKKAFEEIEYFAKELKIKLK